MSHLLWKYYCEDDVDKFRRLLAPAGYTSHAVSRSPNIGSGGGSPGAFGTSPRAVAKSRKTSGYGLVGGGARQGGTNLGRAEVNSRDYAGLTVLLRAASSTSENAIEFVKALLEHPALDLYVQDAESGWNALHRALYSGNISIARLLLEKERKDLTGQTPGASVSRVGQLIKTKDHEGNSPFDLYNSTIGERDLKVLEASGSSDESSEGENVSALGDQRPVGELKTQFDGDELFAFGSNKNFSLGFGDEDDRQFPERVYLKRPDHLLQRFYAEFLEETGLDHASPLDLAKIPAMVLNRPLLIHDAVLSKLHSAVLTTDPISNLYVCGIGRGGRLGLGDENTRFNFVPVQGGLMEKKVVQVALGQNHSMAITDDGELWTWGSNASCQLGYALPSPAMNDEDPISSTPRQVFGSLKKEVIIGIAASPLHSVAHTGTSLYCWGKNVGQLALMDADSRSLDVQQTPRKVAVSLFSSPIVMVSAIDKATTCLLANHTVCVFTGYGYNIVKFPFGETFGNLPLRNMSTRYEAGRNQIQYITSGGETIVALTGRGDLFTMNLNHKIDANPAATSTTNPSKIKGALTQPQCIWKAGKDGVKSVGVSEHGSVIISTHSGSVWRRVKRATAKDAYVSGPAESKRKDFKFQRVPYITKVVSVRSSPFGAFAAIRRDSEVMREQIGVDHQALWDDVAPLCCLQDFKASEPSSTDKDTLKFWNANVLKERLGSVAYEVLKSPDLEADLRRHLTSWAFRNDSFEVALCTSLSNDLHIPVHAWVLAARSAVFRDALPQFRRKGTYEQLELLKIERLDTKLLITFNGLDLMTVLNLVLYMYQDVVIPAWNFSRQAPPLAYRYRQIRAELMKAATHLKMNKLETAVRIQTDPKRCMDSDFRAAIKDRAFFDDGDALVELDGGELPVHSVFLCQRCPWFEGLFRGRSGGLWLASRRETNGSNERVKIDMKHIGPRAFRHVLEYLYADTGAELFNAAVEPTFDDFVDLVMDVMSVANELMLDRLSQICQRVMGRFVNTRSIGHLLNAIGSCSVTEFKDAGLEYICLQMESMLENHLLDELDDELLLELDKVVRDNQRTRYPRSRSGRMEQLLHEMYPDLEEDIVEERQRRVKEMAFRAIQRDDEKKLSSSFKGKFGSLDDFTPVSPTPDRNRRASKPARNEPFSPDLRPKDSQAELMFDMEEEDSSTMSSPLAPPHKVVRVDLQRELDQLSALSDPPSAIKGKKIAADEESPLASPLATTKDQPTVGRSRQSPKVAAPPTNKVGNPWGPAVLPTSKLDLREIIMSESTSSPSALSVGLAAQKAMDTSAKATPTKLSQKERKKQQQQATQTTQAAQDSHPAWEKAAPASRPAPWQAVPRGGKTSLKDVLSEAAATPPTPPAKPLLAAESSSKSIPRRTASPDTRFSGQTRMPTAPTTTAYPATKPTTPSKPLIPHSKSYITRAVSAEPSLPLSMADIIGQQRREQEIVREAVAKRSLQEIQQEQEFQEWWDQESRRTQEEEARRVAREREKEERDKEKGRGRRGRAGKPKGAVTGPGSGAKGGESSGEVSAGKAEAGTSTRGRARGGGGSARA